MGRLLSMLCIIFAVPASASAEGESPMISGTGTVQTGHPASLVIGVTEAEFRVNKCPAKIASHGVDALIADIGARPHFSVKANLLGQKQYRSITGVHSNQTFYSSTCKWISTAYMRPDRSVTLVPANTRWVVVAFPYGSQISVEWKAGTESDCHFY